MILAAVCRRDVREPGRETDAEAVASIRVEPGDLWEGRLGLPASAHTSPALHPNPNLLYFMSQC